jgi:hypothetical protein
MWAAVKRLCDQFWRWIRGIDWRVWAIVAAMFVLVIGTLVIYKLGIGLNPTTHFGAVFASWVGGVALFVVAGAVVAIVSLVRPEQESFDARARILFRRQTGQHIDYIVSRIKDMFEHYSPETSIKITLRGYDETNSKYRIARSNKVILRSYLDDVRSTYHSSVKYSEITLPPPGGEPNRLMFLRIDGSAIGRPAEEFHDTFDRPFSTTIDMDATCEVNYMVEFWTKATDEENNHRTKRYTQLFKLEFENLINRSDPVKIRLNDRDHPTLYDISIARGESREILKLKDIPPNEDVYNYLILAP